MVLFYLSEVLSKFNWNGGMPTLDECFQFESRDTYCDNFQSDLTFTTCLSSYLSFL